MLDVAVVGGGLAGLTALRGLCAQGADAHLFEASDRVGGRLRTDHFEGFTLDYGFQVFFEAYPHARQTLNLDALDLRRFPRGAKVWDGAKWHRLDLGHPFDSLTDDLFPLPDKFLFARYASGLRLRSVPSLRAEPDGSILDELRAVGFSKSFIDRFARPFFGGIFLDASLQTSRNQFRFLVKMLAHGPASLPSGGMSAIPLQLAKGLEGRITVSARVESVSESGIRLESGETVGAKHVIVASDYATTAKLTGLPVPQARNAATQILLDSPAPFGTEAHLSLNGSGEGGINQVVTLNLTATTYAPPGRHLVSAVVLETDADPAIVLEQLGYWRPNFPAHECRVLAKHAIPDAQMSQPPNFAKRTAAIETDRPWLTLAGEVTTNASIDGALQSGLRAAARAMGRLG